MCSDVQKAKARESKDPWILEIKYLATYLIKVTIKYFKMNIVESNMTVGEYGGHGDELSSFLFMDGLVTQFSA